MGVVNMPEADISVPKEVKSKIDWAKSNPQDPHSEIILNQAKQLYPNLVSSNPSNFKKAVAFGVGAAESANPLSIPHDVEATGRAIYKMGKQEVLHPGPIQESPEGILFPGPSKKPLSFSDAISQANQETYAPDLSVKRIISLLPGGKSFADSLPQNYEAAGGIAGAVLGMGMGAKGILKGGKLKQAESVTENVAKDVKFLLGHGDDQVMDAIIKRPEQVRELLNSGNLSPYQLALQTADKLKKTQQDIGTTVGLFRDMAKADTKPSINVNNVLQTFNRVENEAKASTGASALGKTDQAMIEKIRSLLPKMGTKGGSKISASDALLITDTLDQMKLASDAKPGNVHGIVLKALQDIRKDLKNSARSSTGVAKQWALADDAYSQFLESGPDLINKFEGNQGPSIIGSMLNDNKDPIREKLTKALNIISGNEKPSETFFNQLSNLKAAQGLKEVDIKKGDKTADQVNRIYNKWKDRMGGIGEATGAALGGIVGHLIPSVPIAGAAETVGGAYIGGKIGKSMGGMVGGILGEKYGSVENILKNAEKAKILSKEAKDMASDLGFLQKKFGIEGANLFWNSIGSSVPASHELVNFIQAQLNKPSPIGVVK